MGVDFSSVDLPFILTHTNVTSSGHGLQQAPAAGRAVAELLLTGGRAHQTLNLSRLGLRRIMEGKPLLEANIV